MVTGAWRYSFCVRGSYYGLGFSLESDESKKSMLAMVLEQIGTPLKLKELAIPSIKENELLIKVESCGICRTDLHVVDGELPNPKLPLIPGHQIVGKVVELGKQVSSILMNEKVGVSWLGYSCGNCEFCLSGRENLCEKAQYTGYQIDGGFAEYCVAKADYCFPIPQGYSSIQAAPLLCAGLIGYRAYRKIQNVKRIGIYGFGAAAHILTQVAVSKKQDVYAFTRENDKLAQEFAIKLGAIWAGNSTEPSPELLDAAIIFAPEGQLVIAALKNLNKGGTVVCAGIHMSDIPSFPYNILWGERTICSIANLTRRDGEEFLNLAPEIPIQTTVQKFRLSEVNEALNALRNGKIKGAAVVEF